MTRPDQTRPDQTTYAQKSSHKILLVTLYGNSNYGNILQRSALTHILESLGFEAEHLCGEYKLPLKRRIKNRIKHIIKRILASIGVPKYKKKEEIRRQSEPRSKRFQSFQDKHTGRKIFMTFQEALSESE